MAGKAVAWRRLVEDNGLGVRSRWSTARIHFVGQESDFGSTMA